jgi:hypothetical protein
MFELRQALSEDKPFASRQATSPATGTEHQHGMDALNWEILEHPAPASNQSLIITPVPQAVVVQRSNDGAVKFPLAESSGITL